MAIPQRFSRRALLLSSAAAMGCRRPPKATPFSGYCFVANQDGRSVAVVDLTNFHRWPPIPLDAAPSLVLAHPSRPRAYVLLPDAGSVCELDAASLSVSRRVSAGSQLASMRLAGESLWILARNPAALVQISLDSFQPRHRVHLSAIPEDFDLSQDGRAAIVCPRDRTVIMASLDRAAVERTIRIPAEPTSVCFQLDGKQILVGSRPDRSITIFDVPTGRTIVRLPLPLEPRRFCFNSDGGQLFLTGNGMDAVAVVYPYQTEVAETILAGHAPDGMATTGPEAGSYLLVTNPSSNSVTVLNIDDRRLVSVVGVGAEPREILITPDNQYALVLNQKSGDLAVIRLYSLDNPARAHRYKSAALFTLVPVGARPVSAAVVKL
ncbi:MAG TPA: beta-propeller fold lactonase family protein [Bryobacteraceae bacterium]